MNRLLVSFRKIITVSAIAALAVITACSAGAGASVGY